MSWFCLDHFSALFGLRDNKRYALSLQNMKCKNVVTELFIRKYIGEYRLFASKGCNASAITGA